MLSWNLETEIHRKSNSTEVGKEVREMKDWPFSNEVSLSSFAVFLTFEMNRFSEHRVSLTLF